MLLRNDKLQSEKCKGQRAKCSLILLMLALLLFPSFADAQCAMCRAVLETSGDTQKAESVNNGIVYLMAIPYLLVGVLGYFVYRLYSKRK